MSINSLKFSVSMCAYGKDNPTHFKIALDSILEQTQKPNEVVLVVDGPITLELDNVISDYENISSFKVVRLEENLGHGNARRVGIENCSYDLIALMDADDISKPNRFEKQLHMFQANPTIDIVGGQIAEFITNPNEIVGKRFVPQTDTEIKSYLKKRCPINQMTAMLRKTSINAVGGYIDWYCNEDYYLWVRMYLANMVFANINEVLVNVRVGEDMYQRRGGLKYFYSEARLQKYMLDNKVINFFEYIDNILKRFIVQILLPNKIRGWVFKKFARIA